MAAPYRALARIYDQTVGGNSFLHTRQAFETLVPRLGIRFASAADIGCGTGLFARYLAERWRVPVFAVDLSPDMLRVAARNGTGGVTVMRQDVRCLRLPASVDLVTVNFDTFNHLLSEGELKQALMRIYANLRPGGHLVFDLLTPCQAPATRVVRFRPRRLPLVLEQHIRWNAREHALSTTVTLVSRGLIATERHVERVYDPVAVGRWLQATGFEVRAILDAATLRLAAGCPPRVVIIARRPLHAPLPAG